MENKRHFIIPVCLLLVWAVVMALFPLNIQINRGQEAVQSSVVLTVGEPINAAGLTPDYIGTTSTRVKEALDALPATGGTIQLISAAYTFSDTVSRAINNVTIKGVNGTTVSYNASDACFSVGSQTGWKFEDLITDDGGITGYNTAQLINVTLGTVHYGFRAADGTSVSASNVTGTVNAPTGRAATYVIADDTDTYRSQADAIVTAGAHSDEISTIINALPDGSTVLFSSTSNFQLEKKLLIYNVDNLTLKGGKFKVNDEISTTLASGASSGTNTITVASAADIAIGQDIYIGATSTVTTYHHPETPSDPYWQPMRQIYDNGESNIVTDIDFNTLTLYYNLANTYTGGESVFSCYDAIYIVKCDNIEIDGLVLDGNRSNQTACGGDILQNGLRLDSCRSPYIHGCYVHDVVYNHIMCHPSAHYNTTDVLISNNRVKTSSVSGDNLQTRGIVLEDSATGLVSDNHIDGPETGMYQVGETLGSYVGNTVLNCVSYGFLGNSPYCKVTGNSFVGCTLGHAESAGIRVYGSTGKVDVSDNLVLSCTGKYGIAAEAISGMSITGNKVLLYDGNYAFYTNGPNCFASNNSFQGVCASSGMTLNGAGAVFTGNNINLTANTYLISITADKVNFSNNIVDGTVTYGVYCTASGCAITGNTFNPATAAIRNIVRMDGATDGLISSNTFCVVPNLSNSYAIQIGAAAHRCTVSNNKILSAYYYAIKILGSQNLLITGNTIKDGSMASSNTYPAIEVLANGGGSMSNTISNNKIYQTGAIRYSYCITTDAEAFNTVITGNTLSGYSTAPIQISNTSITISGNASYVAPGETVNYSQLVAANGRITLLTGRAGFGKVIFGNSVEYSDFYFTADGVVTLVNNTANVVNTDTDEKYCIYDAGSGPAVKNRSGGALTVTAQVCYQ